MQASGPVKKENQDRQREHEASGAVEQGDAWGSLVSRDLKEVRGEPCEHWEEGRPRQRGRPGAWLTPRTAGRRVAGGECVRAQVGRSLPWGETVDDFFLIN